MTWWFLMRASGAVMRQHPWTALRLIATSLVGILVIVMSASWALAQLRQVDQEASTIRVEMFLLPELADSVAMSTMKAVRAHPGITAARLVRESEAWDEFSSSVGPMDDLRPVVHLPQRIRIWVQAELMRADSLAMLASELRTTHSMVATDVVWPREYVQALDARRTDLVLLGSIAVGSIIILSLLSWIGTNRTFLASATEAIKASTTLGSSRLAAVLPTMFVMALTTIVGSALAYGCFVGLQQYGGLAWMMQVHHAEALQWCAVLCAANVLLVVWQSVRTAGRIAKVRRPR